MSCVLRLNSCSCQLEWGSGSPSTRAGGGGGGGDKKLFFRGGGMRGGGGGGGGRGGGAPQQSLFTGRLGPEVQPLTL